MSTIHARSACDTPDIGRARPAVAAAAPVSPMTALAVWTTLSLAGWAIILTPVMLFA